LAGLGDNHLATLLIILGGYMLLFDKSTMRIILRLARFFCIL